MNAAQPEIANFMSAFHRFLGLFPFPINHIKDFLETDEKYLLNAQTFLSECQKSDVKDIKNSAILFLGMLSVEKESDIRNTIRGLKFDDEQLNDNYIFIQTLLDLDKKPQSVIRALNNLKGKQTIPELLINLILVIEQLKKTIIQALGPS